MSKRIEQIITSSDAKLDLLRAKAEAFDANLTLSKQKVRERVEQRKQALRDALDRFKAEIQRQEDLAAEKKQKLAAEIDELKVQIALGKAETRDALETQRKKISDAIARLESNADKEQVQMQDKVDAAWDAMIHQYVSARDALDAELEAAGIRITSVEEKVGEAFEQGKKEIAQKIASFKRQLAEKRPQRIEKRAQFETELAAGLDQIAKAFKRLFS